MPEMPPEGFGAPQSVQIHEGGILFLPRRKEAATGKPRQPARAHAAGKPRRAVGAHAPAADGQAR